MSTCVQCQKPSGTRVMKEHKPSGYIVHSRCYNDFASQWSDAEYLARSTVESLEREAIAQRRLDAVARRGTNPDAFARDTFNCEHEDDQKIGHVMWQAIHRQRGWGSLAESFIDDFNEDPCHALGWSQKMFKAAADREAALVIIDAFRRGYDFSDIHGLVLDNVQRYATAGTSTMPTSNILDTERAKSWAEYLREMR